jgi:hypothetical protein
MPTRQKHRNTTRQPFEERLRQALQDAAPARATIRVEVHHHDGIRGGVLWVDLQSSLAADELSNAQEQLTALAKANIPKEHAFAPWSLMFQLSGKPVASADWFEA